MFNCLHISRPTLVLCHVTQMFHLFSHFRFFSVTILFFLQRDTQTFSLIMHGFVCLVARKGRIFLCPIGLHLGRFVSEPDSANLIVLII